MQAHSTIVKQVVRLSLSILLVSCGGGGGGGSKTVISNPTPDPIVNTSCLEIEIEQISLPCTKFEKSLEIVHCLE